MNYEEWRFWLYFVQVALWVATGIYLFFSRRSAVRSAQFENLKNEMAKKLDDHEARIVRVESSCAGAPDHDDLSKVYDSVNALAATVNQMVGGMDALKGSVDLMHQYLLNNSNKEG